MLSRPANPRQPRRRPFTHPDHPDCADGESTRHRNYPGITTPAVTEQPEALHEALKQQREVVYDAVAEALEDLAMVHAIGEGDRGDYVSREDIFSIIEGTA